MAETHADPVLEDITRTLVDRVAPERLLLFGSRARGDHHADSDYDIIVVVESALARSERTKVVYEAMHGRRYPIDFIVYTPEEFERRRGDVGTLAYAAEAEGRVLYDRVPGLWPRRVREERRDPPPSVAEWLARARSDFDMMSVGLRFAPNARDAIVFHAHQATEKLLKAVLVSRFVSPPRTHILGELLERCPAELRDDPGVSRACTSLDALWPAARYPDDSMPGPSDVTASVENANTVRDTVEAAFDLG